MQRIEYTKMFELEDTHFWFLGKRYFVDSVLAKYTKNIKTILDLGSGTGGLTRYLQKYGVVTGVEQYPFAISLVNKRGLKIINKDVQNINFKNKTFDLVTIFDVLYHKHITNEKLVLKRVNKLLKNGGYLLITDSAFSFLKSSHDIATQGARRYTIKQMTELVSNNGFKVIKASYVYFSIFLPTLIYRYIRVNKSPNSDVFKIPKYLNKILIVVLRIEAKLLKLITFPIGSSVIVLAVKNERIGKN